MGRVAVIESRVAGLGAVEVAVEGGDFDSHFGDEVAGQVGREGRRVVRRAAVWRIQSFVEQIGYRGLAPHGCGVIADVVRCGDAGTHGEPASGGGRGGGSFRANGVGLFGATFGASRGMRDENNGEAVDAQRWWRRYM